jgi:hypothetical protein
MALAWRASVEVIFEEECDQFGWRTPSEERTMLTDISRGAMCR